jgi:hypothetical protein
MKWAPQSRLEEPPKPPFFLPRHATNSFLPAITTLLALHRHYRHHTIRRRVLPNRILIYRTGAEMEAIAAIMAIGQVAVTARVGAGPLASGQAFSVQTAAASSIRARCARPVDAGLWAKMESGLRGILVKTTST